MLFGRKKADSASGKHETTEAKLIHCPACGYPMSSLDIKCPACNCEIRDGKASTSIKNLVDSLAKIDSQKEFFLGGLIRSFTGNLSDKVNRKVETIKNFPIPNEKKDIFDLVHLAASNINAEILVAKEPEDVNLSNEDFKTQKLLVQTWSDKMESAFLKAKSLFGNDPDFSKVSDIYSAKKAEIESLIKKKKRGVTIAVVSEKEKAEFERKKEEEKEKAAREEEARQLRLEQLKDDIANGRAPMGQAFLQEIEGYTSMIDIWKKWNEGSYPQYYPEVDEFITKHKEFERMYGRGGFNNSLRQLKELLSE